MTSSISLLSVVFALWLLQNRFVVDVCRRLKERKSYLVWTTVGCLAACMTWELADSGNEFITSVINGVDLVPTFSAASVDDLRAEASSISARHSPNSAVLCHHVKVGRKKASVKSCFIR